MRKLLNYLRIRKSKQSKVVKVKESQMGVECHDTLWLLPSINGMFSVVSSVGAAECVKFSKEIYSVYIYRDTGLLADLEVILVDIVKFVFFLLFLNILAASVFFGYLTINEFVS